MTAACGALSGKLLLTGGGVVKTAENYAALHQNGRIYQLLRPLELLPTDGRPLSQGADLAAMWGGARAALRTVPRRRDRQQRHGRADRAGDLEGFL